MKTLLLWTGILNAMVAFGALMTFRWDNVPLMFICLLTAGLCIWSSNGH
jgi:hypothetical protein